MRITEDPQDERGFPTELRVASTILEPWLTAGMSGLWRISFIYLQNAIVERS